VLDAITETRADGVAMMREMISEAHHIIDPHWELLEELARELLQYRERSTSTRSSRSSVT
jgi:hypothetical protein